MGLVSWASTDTRGEAITQRDEPSASAMRAACMRPGRDGRQPDLTHEAGGRPEAEPEDDGSGCPTNPSTSERFDDTFREDADETKPIRRRPP